MGFRDSEFICFFDMELMAIANSSSFGLAQKTNQKNPRLDLVLYAIWSNFG